MTGIPGVTHHARIRMAERYGRDLTQLEWLAVVLAILDGRAVRLRSMPANGSGEIYAVQVSDVALRVVWQPQAAAVVTVLASEHGGTRYHQGKPGRIRKSLLTGGGWKRGRRKPVRTVWQ